MESDNDIFYDDDDDDGGGGDDDAANEIMNSNSSTITFETDNRSEDSISTVTTISSDQTHSEQSSSSEQTNFSEQTSDSMSSRSVQSEAASIEENPQPVVDAASNALEIQPVANVNMNSNNEVINLDSPSPPKKRKRLSLEASAISCTPKVKARNENDLDDEDDGLTCPICLDNWEMSGEHRLASLKCGHLFGDSCIRRWLQESSRQSGQKVCPQCKTKAHAKDIRYLYAKRLRAIDRSEEHRMREQLTEVQSKAQSLTLELATLKMSYAQVTQKLKALESDNDSLNVLLRNGGGSASNFPKIVARKASLMYKLFMERNIEISREPGCRVLTYAKEHTALIVSQKSIQNLFPGYGLRFVDTISFKPTNFLHTSLKLVRDISLSDDQQLLAAASMESKVKLFDLRTLSVAATFKPAEKPLWSCSLGRRDSEHFLYLGSQQGSIYVYDTRLPDTILSEHQAEGDFSPVIQVASIPSSQLFPCGGFLVCKLTSLWFYEHTGGVTRSTRLAIEGRFISMDFNAAQFSLLVQTRSCARYPRARYILGKLNKINSVPVYEIQVTFFASTNSPVMARCSQITVDSNTLVASYIQDSKLLSLYDANREQCIQSLPAQDIIYDTCPIYTKDFTYLAALTETKCRLYKLNST
ncbi:E3 ubiquitin-protein ligase RFWD3 isoform X2 [Lucilia sericata]|nr:E3 ubiquitin-protein ligase RFWD3 isoform X2 [Lucilia sericata]XP_037821880.1 E3 ubiquitin-protein ligase RFWD3 isoform X2 [Lucilia sericata]